MKSCPVQIPALNIDYCKKLRICLTFLTTTFNFYQLTIPLFGAIIYWINYTLLNIGEL